MTASEHSRDPARSDAAPPRRRDRHRHRDARLPRAGGAIMSLGLFLVAVVGGGAGAALRFIVDGLVMRHVAGGFPWGTFVVNATGSLLLGFLTGLADSAGLEAGWLYILGGVMGGYTTFSTAMVDTVHLWQKRASWRFLLNSVGMLVVTVAAALVGLVLGRAI